jgi:hypothetical protein
MAAVAVAVVLSWSVRSASAAPNVQRGFQGTPTIFDISGAMGPRSYIEFNNFDATIFTRSGSVVDMSSTFMDVGSVVTRGDPQILWDPATARFYYAVMGLDTSSGEQGLAWGFSTMSNPRSLTTQFCHYWQPWQGLDFEKMGDSRDFLLITDANVSILWISKPPPGSTCPGQDSFLHGMIETPGTLNPMATPAVEVDPSGTGWLIAVRGNPVASEVSLVPVRRNPETGAARLGPAVVLGIPEWSAPPRGVPQRGTRALIDLRTLWYWAQSVAAVDHRIGRMAVWMQWTAAGGAGSEVRWLEIAPRGTRGLPTPRIIQGGEVASPHLNVFSGSISPDRAVNGGTSAYGADMVLGFLTSSKKTFPAVRMVSKVGDRPQSRIVLVRASDGPATMCSHGLCRFADYTQAASPDPVVHRGRSTGAVWLANHLMIEATDQTWVWKALP